MISWVAYGRTWAQAPYAPYDVSRARRLNSKLWVVMASPRLHIGLSYKLIGFLSL